MKLRAAPAIESLESRRLLSSSPLAAHLIGDYANQDFAITSLTQAGTRAYFSRTVDGASSLWATDGTVATTRKLIDVAKPDWIVATTNGAFFGVNDTLQVYFTDGTAGGTHAIGGIGSALSNPAAQLATIGDKLAIVDPSVNAVLIGDSSGLTPIDSTFNTSAIWVTTFNNRWYFRTDTALCSTDGTTAGTVSIKSILKGNFEFGASAPLVAQGAIWFSRGNELWRSDGTSSGTGRVNTPQSFVSSSTLDVIVGVGNGILFRADVQQGDISTSHLFFNDGTNTTDLTNAATGQPAGALDPTYVGNTLYFVASFGESSKLFTTDGTVAGTRNLGDTIPAIANLSPANLTAFGKFLYFTSGRTIWRTDGTKRGTRAEATRGDTSFGIASVGGNIVFESPSATYDDTILILPEGDGSPTAILRDVPNQSGSSHANGLIARDGKIFFSADVSQRDARLPAVTTMFLSDGRSTQPLPNAVHGFGIDPTVQPIATPKGIFFAGTTTKPSLWLLDGDHNNSLVLLKGNFRSISDITGDATGGVLFAARTNDSGMELWKSDGTVDGTVMVTDIVPGTHGSDPANITLLRGGKAVFTADDGVHGRELWVTDGTSDGTELIDDARTGAPSGFATDQPFVIFKGVAYTTPYTTGSGYKLLRTDGTSAGTYLVTSQTNDITAHATGTLVSSTRGMFFSTVNTPSLYISDGSGRGTTRLISLSSKFRSISSITVADRITYFVATDNKSTQHLFSTDGTVVGTHEIRLPAPIGTTNSIASLYPVQNNLMFSLSGSISDAVYQSDNLGRLARTVSDDGEIVRDGAIPMRVNSELFFNATTANHGEELWEVDI